MVMDYDLELGNRQTLPLTVSFSWVDGYRGDFYEPPSGSGIEDYHIYLYLGDKKLDVTEIFDDNVRETIIAGVEESYRGA